MNTGTTEIRYVSNLSAKLFRDVTFHIGNSFIEKWVNCQVCGQTQNYGLEDDQLRYRLLGYSRGDLPNGICSGCILNMRNTDDMSEVLEDETCQGCVLKKRNSIPECD